MIANREHQELVVITKTCDLILWSCHHTGKFPGNHRFVLDERIERTLYDLLETLIRAKYSRQRAVAVRVETPRPFLGERHLFREPAQCRRTGKTGVASV
jgi:hypothetical protein